MAGVENFAAMLNNMSDAGAGHMAALMGALTQKGAGAYAQFCNRATPELSKAFAAWLGEANPGQIKQVAARLNSGASIEPASLIGWLHAGCHENPVPARKWWQFWKGLFGSGSPKTGGGKKARATASGAATKKTAEQSVQFRCGKCNKLLKSNLIGKLVRCPGCQEPTRVPEPSGEAMGKRAAPTESGAEQKARTKDDVEPSATCAACGRAVKTTTRPKPDWYGTDQVDWQCSECHSTFCGECSTAKVQELKKKYGATGLSLKTAINNDPMALYDGWELAPHCPRCRKRTLDVARSQDASKSRHAEATRKPDRARAKILNDEGIAVAQRGNSELAMQKLQAAIDADPTWSVPWNNLGVVYRDMGANGEAMNCLAKATALKAFD